MDATEFIRAQQRQEGCEPCFRTRVACDEVRCAWRTYCLEKGPPDDYVEMLQTWMITEK